ncbi:MAG: protein-glutamate O-methyltransferase CheR [Phycisphaerales bacterium]|jgi:chemotaxis protein methyltransferase CheR|nr:protein-glutamate O-methyltransferase CheR [Phycisphaerales bacterium]
MKVTQNENIEISLLLEAIYLKYGYDFRNYAMSSVRRRIARRLKLSGLDRISEIQHRMLRDTEFFESLLCDLSINITEMFRDADFFAMMRDKVLPIYADCPSIKIWHAGCASGEEVYSMAILLHEAGLTDRTRIYATDFNEPILAQARQGLFPIDRIKEYTVNYQRAGGRHSFADYYTAEYDSAIIRPFLRKNIVFADHNLATDSVFAEVDLIICRNVMIYFGKQLQDHVLGLFHDSLCDNGILCLGSMESLNFSSYSDRFSVLAPDHQIYSKTATALAGECGSIVKDVPPDHSLSARRELSRV